MSLEEFSESVKAALYDRLKTPFFASFLVAWVCWNWDFLYFLSESESFASTTISDARDYINWCKGLWYPLLTSLLVFTIGGLLNLLYYWIRLGLRRIRIETLDKKDTITTEQRDTLIEEHIRNRKSLSDRVAELHDEVSEVRLANEDLKRQNQTLLLEVSAVKARPQDPRQDDDGPEADIPSDVSPSPLSPTSSTGPDYVFDETFVARDGAFETMSAKVLSSNEGCVIAWFEVNNEHIEGSEEAYMYVLAHAGDNGRRATIGGADVYKNTWAILRVKGKAPQWRFVTSNKYGTSGSDKFVDRRPLSRGWHSIAVAWSRKSEVIDFFVDGVLKATDVFSYWPDKIESTMTLGTWPIQSAREFDFRGKVGPVQCYHQRLDEPQVRRIDLDGHLKLHNLERYFPGTWELEYAGKGQTGYDKNVQIRDGNKYYVNGRLQFILEEISGNLDEGLLMFTKRRVNDPSVEAENRLRIVQLGRRYEGLEYGDISVKYYRVD